MITEENIKKPKRYFPKIGDVKHRKCTGCGLWTDCYWDANPYAAEIWGDLTPKWQCWDCRYESAMDI
jgi:hypothetical protein